MSYNDHITNEKPLENMMNSKRKQRWFGHISSLKDDSTRYSEKKKKEDVDRRRDGKTVLKTGQK